MSVERRGGVALTPRTVDLAVRAVLGRLDVPSTGGGGRLDALVDGGRLLGFWLRLDETWLDQGPAAGPARTPPLVEDVLGALVEAVWWRGTPVDGNAGAWELLLVLEYPPELAVRAELAPPGDGSAVRQAPVTEPEGQWLDATPRPAELPDEVPTAAPGGLLVRRSLLTLIRARLGLRGSAHRGRAWLVVPPAELDGAEPDVWVPAVRKLTERPLPKEVSLGPALGIEAGAVGHTVPGWFARTLVRWPREPAQVEALELAPRDVSNRLFQQLRAAVGTTIAASGLILLVSLLVALAVQPQAVTAPAPPTREAQPALSVCSADHAPFVSELRCQVNRFATGPSVIDEEGRLRGPEEDPSCRDDGAVVSVDPPPTDLQMAWCGLRDRDEDVVDGGRGKRGLTRLAAARACFNVLGHPITYAAGAAGRRDVEVARMLDEPAVRIGALVDVVAELDRACDYYGPRLDAELDGAIVAAFVGREGAEEDEPVRLREAALRAAAAPLPAGLETCLRTGAAGEVQSASHYAEVCGGSVAPVPDDGAWAALGGEAEGPLAARYAAARFGPATEAEPPARWACEGMLRQGISAGELDGAWGRRLLGPTRLASGGGWGDQLSLDAAVVALRGEVPAPGPCWEALGGALERYAPAHPLVRPLDPKGWPHPDQQVCGQVCAASMAVATATAGSGWVTPQADLDGCVSTGAPAEVASAVDPLTLPWNARVQGAWAPARQSDVCAYHLLAQGWLDSALPPGTSGLAWSGETALGSRVAGGATGAAPAAVENLLSFAGSRSVAVCRSVATECLLGGALDVTRTGSPGAAVSRWQAWVGEVAASRSRDVRDDRPWCGLVQTWLPRPGTHNDGQLDYPCAKGVADAYAAVESTLTSVVGGAR